MTEEDQDRSTHRMVENLHVRFDHLESHLNSRFEEIHSDHNVLRARVDEVEREVATDVSNLKKHESEACLREQNIILRLKGIKDTQHEQHIHLAAHTAKEERFQFWLLVTVSGTLLATLGTLGTILLTKALGA